MSRMVQICPKKTVIWSSYQAKFPETHTLKSSFQPFPFRMTQIGQLSPEIYKHHAQEKNPLNMQPIII